MKNKQDLPTFKVHVICMTYNHVEYIEEAMNGFCKQETNFPFICTIFDDASTDGEQEVVKKYLRENFDFEDELMRREETDDYILTFARHRTNKNCYFAVFFLKYNHYSIKKAKLQYSNEWEGTRYVALCEGDDYWTHPKKLQKQANALEQNPECSICFGATETINRRGEIMGGRIPSDTIRLKEIVTLEDFCREQFTFGQWTFHTTTFLYRKDMWNAFLKMRQSVFRDFPYGDLPCVLTCLIHGNGYFINDVMSSYRIDSGGFNSSLKGNPQKAIRIEKDLIKGMLAFDEYTGGKYHPHVRKRILRSECLIEFHEKGDSGYVFFKPKYWPIIKMQGYKNTALMIGKTAFPRLYRHMQKLLKRNG